jgi:hypothetical protein
MRSIIERQIDSPIPAPPNFVLNNESNTRSSFSGSIPGPESRSETSTPPTYASR